MSGGVEGTWEQIQRFFTYTFPEMLRSGFEAATAYAGENFWWIFLLLATIFGLLFLKAIHKIQKINLRKSERDNFLGRLAAARNLSDLDKVLYETLPKFGALYSAIYRKRGETYILYSSSVSRLSVNVPVSIPLRISISELSNYKESGNYKISSFRSLNEDFLMLVYAREDISEYLSHEDISLILAYYEKFFESTAEEAETTVSRVNENASHVLHEIAFAQNGYMKIISAMVLRISGAAGAEIVDNEGNTIVTIGSFSAKEKKTFYIRNTSFRFILASDSPLQKDEIKQIGSFLDLAGIFFALQDDKSYIAQNFMQVLIKANELLESRNPHYRYHSDKVRIVALEIGKSLFLGKTELQNLELAAQVHDIGMIGDLESVLEENKEFDANHFDPIKNHPILGAVLVEPVSSLYPIGDLIKYHHERYDGRGYPFGIMSADTPLESRILALAEAYIGLISDRPYRKGFTKEEARKEIEKAKTKAFDPTVVQAFEDAFDETRRKLERFELKHKNQNDSKEEGN